MAQQAVRQQQRQVQQPPDVSGLSANPLELAEFDRSTPLCIQMITNPKLQETVQWICKAYAGSPTAPDHVKGNAGVVLTALDMALSTNLNPLYLMNCMYDPGNGRLGLMAEAVHAALRAKHYIIGDIEWIELGDWSQVQSKFVMVESQKKQGKKYPKATYKDSDEQGLGITMKVHWFDRPEPTEYGPYWLKDQHPRFSTKWAFDPLSQMKDKVLRTVQKQKRPELLNSMAVGEEAEPDYYGPENAKVVGESSTDPKSKLDGFAQKQKARRQAKATNTDAKPSTQGDDSKASNQKGAATKQKETPKDDGPHWEGDEPPLEGEVVQKDTKEMDFGDADDSQVEGVNMWFYNGGKGAEQMVERAKVVPALVRAMQKAINVATVNALFNNNKEAYQLLDEDERQVIKDTMDERARVLDDG